MPASRTSSSTPVHCRCNFCNKKFNRVITARTVELTCPRCRETDVDIIGTIQRKPAHEPVDPRTCRREGAGWSVTDPRLAGL